MQEQEHNPPQPRPLLPGGNLNLNLPPAVHDALVTVGREIHRFGDAATSLGGEARQLSQAVRTFQGEAVKQAWDAGFDAGVSLGRFEGSVWTAIVLIVVFLAWKVKK